MQLNSLGLGARKIVRALALISTLIAPVAGSAQQLNTQAGRATEIDIVETARKLSLQDSYARALYLFLRANPTSLDNPQFYVAFLTYLMSTEPGFRCDLAFSNEFERRDYFTQAFNLREQLRSVVNSVTIPQRFDVTYAIDTGRYDFTAALLPFSRIQSVGSQVSSSIVASNGRYCAQQVLNGTTVDTTIFPWQFEVVNEAGERQNPRFPFGDKLQLPSDDARVLFERFGRQLYAIVGYQFQAASNGEPKIQIIPTDGQLFGLSTDAVVRVKSYAHPTLSQPSYLDITSPLEISADQVALKADLVFKQQGFRAVGTGTRQDPGTDITIGGTFPIGGSAAVGGSAFIMRLAVPQLISQVAGLRNLPGSQRYLTLFGSVDFGKVTADRAPVSGVSIVLQVEPEGNLRETQPFAFSGAFRAEPVAEETAEAEAAPSLLDDGTSESTTSTGD